MDVLCTALDIDMSDFEIKECIKTLIPVCTTKRQGFCLTINGFDKDRRELWQIPEAICFMRRLCELGFISALEVSTTCADFFKERYKVDKLPGFGAIEVWMCATDRMANGKNGLDRATFTAFYADLDRANGIAEKIINGTSSPSEIPDAPIKHHGLTNWKLE